MDINNVLLLLLILSSLLIGISMILMYRLIRKTVYHFLRLPGQAATKDKYSLILNAYERLTLLCERIQPDKLAIRLQSPHLTSQALSQAMIVAIHQEFEHNITQQIYVSENLWNIISLSKEEAIFEIISTAGELSPDSESKLLTQKLLEKKQDSHVNPALKAIRKEAHYYVKI